LPDFEKKEIKIFDTTRERFMNEEERKETHDMLN
jgi:hypothetical protein